MPSSSGGTGGEHSLALRILKWAAIVLGALLLIVAALGFWLLRTESGLHFVLGRALDALEGKVTVEHTSGLLLGPLTLEGLRYRDADANIDAKVGRLLLDIKPSDLIARQVHVLDLDINDVEVALTTVPPKPAQPAGEFSLKAPVDIVLDRLALKNAKVSQDGKPVFAADSLDLAGQWTHAGALVKTLALRSPDGSVDLDGTVAATPGYPGNGRITFHWKVADAEYAGTLEATGDGKQARLDVALTSPTTAKVDATITQSGDLPWSAKIDVPSFDPNVVRKDIGVSSVALGIEGSGDKTHGSVHGRVVVDEHTVELDPFTYAFDGKTLRIDALNLKTPEAAGTLHATGSVRVDAQPIAADLVVAWDGVEIPAGLAGQALATHGKLNASGSAEKFHADGALAIGPPGKLSDLAVDVDGTPDLITLKKLALKQAKGGLDAAGTIALKPALGWKITAKADRLDPGAFSTAWPGALDFDLASEGRMTDKGPDATIKLDKLGGSLRKRPLSGNADLRVKPGYVVDGTLAVASGKSRVDVAGSGSENQTDATIKLAIASLGDWLPDMAGRLDGQFRVQGKWPKLAVSGSANGAGIVSGTTRIGGVQVDASATSLDPPQGKATIKASAITSGSVAIDRLSIVGSGSQKSHELTLDATGTPLSTRLDLSGSASSDGKWSGTLKTLDIAIKDVPKLTMEKPAQLAWDGQQFTSTDLCVIGGGPRLCVSGKGGSDGTVAARYRLEQLPLAMIAKLAAPETPFKADGIIAGSGNVERSAAGALSGHAAIGSDKGGVAYADNPAQPLLTYAGFAIDVQLSPQSTHATVRSSLNGSGKLDGEVTVSGAPGSTQGLSGKVDLTLDDLGFVELVTSEVANTKGRLAAHYTIAGTTSAPQLNGALTLKDFATEVPLAGLKLHDGDISVKATDAEHFVLNGTLKSGDGTLTLAGAGGVGATAPLKASIKGDNFLAADIPAAKVVISPDITIERGAENLKVGGTIEIPKTDVDLTKLPGGGVSKRSPDVVIADADQPGPGKPLPVQVAVTVKFGHEVKLKGLGLDGKVRGQLAVNQRPGRSATGTGTINVTGTYKAYGQDLTIENGRLLFAGTALDNPGLDIRAVRKILGSSGGQLDDTITAGLMIRGTALVPVLTVFSEPALEQSEALSYLLTGKPLSGLKSGEGDMLSGAARALGSAGGGLLAKNIGSRVGVEAGVSDSQALGGSAFTVGKYLSPKLYLSYGVGLFTPGEVITLRYLFNRRFNFEAQNATTGNRAGVNYRYEH